MVSEPAMQHMKKPKDINTKIAEFVKIVTEVGPDIPLIAKRMGEHKESVRYWFKKLIKQGMVIQPSVNFEKLGLARVVAVVDFAKEFESQAEPILIAMSQLCYVQSFIKTLPDGHYIVHGAVPVESVGIWMEMMRSLKDERALHLAGVLHLRLGQERPHEVRPLRLRGGAVGVRMVDPGEGVPGGARGAVAEGTGRQDRPGDNEAAAAR